MDQKKNRVLAVGAHPDDVEFMCSGTMQLLKDKGLDLFLATLTGGDLGTEDRTRDEIRDIRLAEARASCLEMGASFHFLGFDDFEIFYSSEAHRKVTALLRDVDPDIVITHPPQDYMADHEITSSLVRSACFSAPVPGFDLAGLTESRNTSRIPYLYYSQPMEGRDIYGTPIPPGMFVDISGVLDRKESYLACHVSQRDWLRKHHGIDEYLESMRRWSRELGKQASDKFSRSIEYAEAFRQHRGHAYPSGNIIASILGDKVME
ncbi:MAG: PIG-L deacetylase family protein [Acidobacteriota bacterium]